MFVREGVHNVHDCVRDFIYMDGLEAGAKTGFSAAWSEARESVRATRAAGLK
jgi:hypothetical protein